MDSPIGLELFDFVDEAVEEIGGSEQLLSELDADGGLLLFVRDFYLQLFENVLAAPITSIGERSGQRANQLMRGSGRTWSKPVRTLVRRFQHLCKVYPELLGEQYESSDAIAEFQREFVLDMLSEVADWATSAGLPEVALRAEGTEAALRAAIEETPTT